MHKKPSHIEIWFRLDAYEFKFQTGTLIYIKNHNS